MASPVFSRACHRLRKGRGRPPTKGITSLRPRLLLACSSYEGRKFDPGTLPKANRGHKVLMELVDWATELNQKDVCIGKLQSENVEVRRSRDAAVVEAIKEKVDSLVKEKVDSLAIDRKWAIKFEKKVSEKQGMFKVLEVAKNKAEEVGAVREAVVPILAG